MRFVIGLALGAALGFAATVLLAPQRPREEERAQGAPLEEELEAAAHENHDFTAILQRALRSLQSQLQEAWAEALEAAEEAEREIQARYQRMAHRTARRDE